MSDFKAKMHQIVCRLGLHPRPRWGSLQRSPRPPSWILGGLLLRGGNGQEGKGSVGERREGEGRKEGREGTEGAVLAPQAKACPPELFSWRRRCCSPYQIFPNTKSLTPEKITIKHSYSEKAQCRPNIHGTILLYTTQAIIIKDS